MSQPLGPGCAKSHLLIYFCSVAKDQLKAKDVWIKRHKTKQSISQENLQSVLIENIINSTFVE